jgi:hypothetical protein
MLFRSLPALWIYLAIIFFISPANAQDNAVPIKLVVFSFFENQPLEGVHVVINDILRVNTNAQGYAALQVRPDDNLVLSMIGFELKVISALDLSWSAVNNVYLIPQIITLPGITVESTWPGSDVLLPLRTPIIVNGINDHPVDTSPVKPGTFASGYDPSTLAPTVIFMGPFTYFSSKEKQKRKLARAIKSEEPDKLKNLILADPDIKESFLSIYHIDETLYYEFLSFFNARNEETSFLSAYDLLESMHLEFKNYRTKSE